jgi:hypothetical protein
MSFEVYVQFFQNGTASGVPRGLVKEVFTANLDEQSTNSLRVQCGPNDECMVQLQPLSDGSELIHFLTIERPCLDEQLWRDVISTLHLGNGVLYFPGGRPLVTDVSVALHIPGDMLDALGEPIAVAEPNDIILHLRSV